jgi:nicotinate phosphoribosyltransferase
LHPLKCVEYQLTTSGLSTLRLHPEEREALAQACPYFPEFYLDYLSSLILRPQEQVNLIFHPKDSSDMGEIECVIRGLWKECILYEVPIMSIGTFTWKM